MKICSLYGAGYYYMPGTDICLKLGGYVRYQHYWAGRDGTQPLRAAFPRSTRTDDMDTHQRARAIVTIDTRQQTAYGTLRTYLLIGMTFDSNQTPVVGGAALYATRAFIQIAGFTFGRATSFFDIMPGATFAYYSGPLAVPDTGDGGALVAAYTAQLGNGLSATLSFEQPRDRTVNNTNNAGALALGAAGAANDLNQRIPDVVANLRIDQAWGSALIAGALHEASGGYYGAALAGSEVNGHPSNEWGWALTGGAVINLPMIAPGNRFSFQATYSEGAIGYASLNSSTGVFKFTGAELGYGYGNDGVFRGLTAAGGTSVELTTAWAVAAAFEHFWTPALKTSIYGSYLDVSFNPNATAIICAAAANATPTQTATCAPDWSLWNIGSRTEWSPVRGLIFGVDVIYQHLNTAQASNTGFGVVAAAQGSKPAGTYQIKDQDQWSGTFRVQRDFLP